MGIFEEVPLGGGVKWEWGWRRRQFFGDLSGYFFGIFRDMASSIIWRHATPCWSVTDCKMKDLEWPWVAIWRQNPFSANTLLQNRYVLEPTAQIWMKIDPYYQRQKCMPMTVVSGNIRFMRILTGVRLGRGVKQHWVLSTTAVFGDLGGYVFVKTSEICQTILYDDMLPLVGR